MMWKGLVEREGNIGPRVMRASFIFGAALAGALIAAVIGGRNDHDDREPPPARSLSRSDHAVPYQPVSGSYPHSATIRSSSAGLYPQSGQSGAGTYPDTAYPAMQGRVATYPQPIPPAGAPRSDLNYPYGADLAGTGGVTHSQAWGNDDWSQRQGDQPLIPGYGAYSPDGGYNPWVGASSGGRTGYASTPESLGYPAEQYDPYDGRSQGRAAPGAGYPSALPPGSYPGYGAGGFVPHTGTGFYSPTYGGIGNPMPPIFPLYGAGSGMLPVW